MLPVLGEIKSRLVTKLVVVVEMVVVVVVVEDLDLEKLC
jgi:hypothetical protein